MTRNIPGPNVPLRLVPPSHPALHRPARRIFTPSDEQDAVGPVTGNPSYMISRLRATVSALNNHTLCSRLYPRIFARYGTPSCLALAAPQVGWDWAVYVTADGDVLIDPELISHSPDELASPSGEHGGTTVTSEECLSIPGRSFTTRSPSRVLVRAYDEAGNLLEYDCGGLHARIAFHECDHLRGLTLSSPGNPRVLSPSPLP